jgi:hypothetical protein
MYSGKKYLVHLIVDRLASTTIECQVGFPIRTSRDQRVLSPPPGLSQSATSFIASCCQGIHQTPLSRLIRSRRRRALLCAAGYRLRPVVVVLVGSLTRRRGPRQDASRFVRPSTILRSTRLAVRVSIRLGKTAVVAGGLAALRQRPPHLANARQRLVLLSERCDDARAP